MKTKLRTSQTDPRKINLTLFHSPFNPKVNFALEDPLLLTANEAIQKEGLSYARYFCSNSPLSPKAFEFVKKKKQMEDLFSQKAYVENTVILSYQENILASLEKAFLSSQIFLIPDSIQSPFPKSKTIYFAHNNLDSISDLLSSLHFDHTPILYLPKICPINGPINFTQIEEIKNSYPIFLVVEDNHTFGCEGLNGFLKKADTLLIDLLITHIPKNFGKMLTLISGKSDLLDRLIEYCFSQKSLFPHAAYLGMFSKALHLLESMSSQRNKIIHFAQTLSQTFPMHCKVFSPLIIFNFPSEEEKHTFYKSLVDNGFLLPWSTSNNQLHLTFFINHELEETCTHFIQKALQESPKQVVCETL